MTRRTSCDDPAKLKTMECESVCSEDAAISSDVFLRLAAANNMTWSACAIELAIVKKKRIARRHTIDPRYVLENITRVRIQETSSPINDAFF